MPNAERNPKGVFNTNIEGVSLKPVDGWIPVPAHEVESVLAPAMKSRALRAVRTGQTQTRREVARAAAHGPQLPKPVPSVDFASAKPRAPLSREANRDGSLTKALEKSGVKTVYIAPRRYNAKHGESVTKQLQRKGADTPNDRDMRELHQASLRDRDTRTLNGEKGGWSRQQQENAALIAAAKDTKARAAGNKPNDVSGKMLKFAHRSEGDAEDVAAMVETAKRAGGDTLDKVKAARVANSLSKLQSLGGFGREGGRWLLGANNIFDHVVLRHAYPATRAIEQHGKKMGRVSELGPEKEEIERRKARDKANRPAADSKKSGGKKVRERKAVTKVRERKDD